MKEIYRKNKLFFFILLAAAVIFLLWYFSHIVIFVIVAAVISVIGAPLVAALDKIRIGRFSFPHTLSVTITLLIFIGVFIGLFSMFIPLVMSEAEMIGNIDGEALARYFQKDLTALETFMKRNGILQRNATLESSIKESLVRIIDFGMFSNLLSSVISFTGNFLFNAFSITFLAFFFLKDYKMMPRWIFRISPVKYSEQTKNIMLKSRDLLSRYFTGLLIQIAANVVTYSLAFYIVGVRSPLVMGFFTGIIIIIPYLGGIISMLIGVIMGVTGVIAIGNYEMIMPVAIKILVAMFIVQTIDNNIFAPLIQGKSMKAHPVEIFLVVIAAASFGGILGMVAAVPVYGFIKIIATEFINSYLLTRKLTENR